MLLPGGDRCSFGADFKAALANSAGLDGLPARGPTTLHGFEGLSGAVGGAGTGSPAAGRVRPPWASKRGICTDAEIQYLNLPLSCSTDPSFRLKPCWNRTRLSDWADSVHSFGSMKV